MLPELRAQLQESIKASLHSFKIPPLKNTSIEITIPNDKQFGELSCNIALKLAKDIRKNPYELATLIKDQLTKVLSQNPLQGQIAQIDVQKPGFINFYLTPEAFHKVLAQVFKESSRYGCSDVGNGKKVQIEFVSANPTGPLSVAHARQAAVGDALCNILKAVGFDARREYYINDEGNQINLLGDSLRLRAQSLLTNEPVPPGVFTDDHYHGEYIIDIARKFLEDYSIKSLPQLNEKHSSCALYAVNCLMEIIKKELNDFRVYFDIWTSQSKVATKEKIDEVITFLAEKGFVYEKDGALWFKSTDFEDDKDRVVEKSDGSYTYLTPDIVYHRDKFQRGFDKVINIWGPDHHGYIPRLKASIEALGYDRDSLTVLIVQLATIYRDGKPVSMSTRRGEYISLREVINEVGVDAARFFFLMRHINAHLEFDLELAKKQTPENPVYYIQYAHARIHSVLDKAKEVNITKEGSDFSYLKAVEELDLIKKIGQFPDILLVCHNQLDPYALVSYLQELATCFHKFYDQHKVLSDDKFLSAQRLALIDACRIVLANGLHLLGVSAPQKM